MIKLQYYITDVGIIFSGHGRDIPIINGVKSRKSYNNTWAIADNVYSIKTVEYESPKLAVNKRYQRKDSSPDTLPEVFYENNVPDYFDSICDLYSYICDYEDQPNKQVEFEAEFLGEFKMSKLGDPTSFSFSMCPTRDNYNEQIVDYSSMFNPSEWSDSNIGVDDIVKSVTPDLVWHLYPCSISSNTSYRIIRNYVKKNINLKYARISSDYDFCFTVSKLIPVKPWVSKTEQYNSKGKSYRRPKFTERKITHKEEPIFNITSDKDKYGGYPVIEGFKGESLEDLRLNITNYLDELMEMINRPLSLCTHCEGQGYLKNDQDS